jgi:hypothetical protein
MQILNYYIVWLIVYGVASYRDATKEYAKKWNNGEYSPLFSHSNNWHFETTAIWIVLFGLIAYLQQDYKYLYFYISFLTLDLFYYIWKWFIYPNESFLPKEMNWFVESYKIKGIEINFLRLFGIPFTRSKFLLILVLTNLITLFLLIKG